MRFAASGFSIDARRSRPPRRRSRSVGSAACPGPRIGVTGAGARFLNWPSASALAAEDEARPEDHVLERGGLQVLLHPPLRAVVGHELLRLLGRPERRHQHESATPASRAASSRSRVPCSITLPEVLGLAGEDRDEVDDDSWPAAAARRLAGSVSRAPGTASRPSRLRRPWGVLEHAHGVARPRRRGCAARR